MSHLDEKEAIKILSHAHDCIISLRCRLKRVKWDSNLSQQEAHKASDEALESIQAALKLLTAARSKDSEAGPSEPVNANISEEEKFSVARDNNTKGKRKRECNEEAWIEMDELCDDGYKWAKHGQKPIAGKAHPRSYYHCKVAGCDAKKQVQKCDGGDLQKVQVLYINQHTHMPSPNEQAVQQGGILLQPSIMPSDNGALPYSTFDSLDGNLPNGAFSSEIAGQNMAFTDSFGTFNAGTYPNY